MSSYEEELIYTLEERKSVYNHLQKPFDYVIPISKSNKKEHQNLKISCNPNLNFKKSMSMIIQPNDEKNQPQNLLFSKVENDFQISKINKNSLIDAFRESDQISKQPSESHLIDSLQTIRLSDITKNKKSLVKLFQPIEFKDETSAPSKEENLKYQIIENKGLSPTKNILDIELTRSKINIEVKMSLEHLKVLTKSNIKTINSKKPTLLGGGLIITKNDSSISLSNESENLEEENKSISLKSLKYPYNKEDEKTKEVIRKINFNKIVENFKLCFCRCINIPYPLDNPLLYAEVRYETYTSQNEEQKIIKNSSYYKIWHKNFCICKEDIFAKNILVIRKLHDLSQCKKFLTHEELDILEAFEEKKFKLKLTKKKNSLNSNSPAFNRQDNISKALSLKSMKFPFYEGNNHNIQNLYRKKNIYLFRKYYDQCFCHAKISYQPINHSLLHQVINNKCYENLPPEQRVKKSKNFYKIWNKEFFKCHEQKKGNKNINLLRIFELPEPILCNITDAKNLELIKFEQKIKNIYNYTNSQNNFNDQCKLLSIL